MTRLLDTMAKERRDDDEFNLVAIAWMHDEASQKLRSLLGGSGPKEQSSSTSASSQMQVKLSVMVSLCKIHMDTGSSCRWEPWSVPLRFVQRIPTAEVILAGIFDNYPIKLETKTVVDEIARHCMVVLPFCFDSASANILSFSYIVDLVETSCPKDVVAFGEPCCSHQTHIIKVGGFEALLKPTSHRARL